ncbi:DUF982 domain-containing protein [Neorhizobium sp. P12A]|uniref:DUF982 domain-containing protein n=1 Tax=Neorhizobium sp. P12A TaxID=2268027 RepID=UPI0011EFBDF4|nr:DUF982 domain-containing protein [Neorhizobium sp. P12A]KAA0682684.1 DUF982 domain-containing protein [Neorhizobium sp. P12A]
MMDTKFEHPLFVKYPRYIQELASLEDVFDFLDDWPEEKRGDTYHVLSKACRMAAQGVFPIAAIRENVRRFLIKERVLANIEEVPLFIAKRGTDQSLGS